MRRLLPALTSPALLGLALAACLAAPPAAAQVIPSVDVGVAGGVNFASLGDAGALDFESSTGYHVGLYADVSVLLFQARTGVYYLRAGEIEGQDEAVSFVTVPVDFQLQTPTPVVQAYVLVGPRIPVPARRARHRVQHGVRQRRRERGRRRRGRAPARGPERVPRAPLHVRPDWHRRLGHRRRLHGRRRHDPAWDRDLNE